MNVARLFSVHKPCTDCPFLKANREMLNPGRLEEIIHNLHDNNVFHCHKTVDYSCDSIEEQVKHARYCAGSMVYLEKACNTNVPMRLGLMYGYYDPSKLIGHADVIEPLGLDQYVRSTELVEEIKRKHLKGNVNED